jgi:phosphatidylglycerophosphatase A
MPMSTKTDAASPRGGPSSGAASAASLSTPYKPHIALAIATSLGLGYIPLAPGTWGSLAGIVIYGLLVRRLPLVATSGKISLSNVIGSNATAAAAIAVLLAIVGVWAADRAANFLQRKDPGLVVIDEVSGQFLTYLLALAPLNWKYLLLGFILFRVFDIWKPTPARQAEGLRGGLGIMADDWVAGFYAALGLWIARAAGM